MLQRLYAQEFSEVARAAEERRIIRKNLQAERKLQIRSASGQMYNRMLFIFGDVVHQRRNLRLGFNRWLEVLGKTPKQRTSTAKEVESEPSVAAIQRSDVATPIVTIQESVNRDKSHQQESDEGEDQAIHTR